MSSNTIYALASGRPPAAIAIIRVSGPAAHEAGRRLAGALPPPRMTAVRELRHPATGELLDRALAVRFDGPASSTGEDLVELHCHGGRAVTDSVLGALACIEGLRLANPGEFTRRAFENGRIDLTEAEGLADLLEAETESQRKAALALADGGLRRQIERWQHCLVGLSARAEAAIDYVEEGGEERNGGLSSDCDALASDLAIWLRRPRMEPLRDGVKVVVAGPPNAGKSSLVNAMTGIERVIVTDVPGTTRDHVEVPLSLDGIPIVLTDTAGVRDSSDTVEQIGIARARDQIVRADLLLWLGPPDAAPAHPGLIRLHAQCDRRGPAPDGLLPVSALTGEGVLELLKRIAGLAQLLLPGEDMIALNRRQAALLADALEALTAAAATSDALLVAEHLRQARSAFDRLTGRVGMEDVLDALFGRFCLGK